MFHVVPYVIPTNVKHFSDWYVKKIDLARSVSATGTRPVKMPRDASTHPSMKAQNDNQPNEKQER